MSRTGELFAGVGLSTAMALSLTSYSGSPAAEKPKPAAVAKYAKEMRQLGTKILQIASSAPGTYEAVPYYSPGFIVPTTGGGAIEAQVQLPNSTSKGDKATSLSFEQLLPEKLSFAFLFTLNKRTGTWDASCQENPTSAYGSWEELGESKVKVDGKLTYSRPAIAEAVLSDYIAEANFIVETMADHETSASPFPKLPADICRVNLG